jgi:hypothetical protein
MTGASLQFDAEALRPLIRAVVEETIAALEKDRADLDGRLAFGEHEAARLVSLKSHQLRDMRLRKEISAARGPGGRIMYTRQDLLHFLASRRVNGEAKQ